MKRRSINSPVKRAAVLWVRFIQIISIRSLLRRDFLNFSTVLKEFFCPNFGVKE